MPTCVSVLDINTVLSYYLLFVFLLHHSLFSTWKCIHSYIYVEEEFIATFTDKLPVKYMPTAIVGNNYILGTTLLNSAVHF